MMAESGQQNLFEKVLVDASRYAKLTMLLLLP
jgi:hypothetical protein